MNSTYWELRPPEHLETVLTQEGSSTQFRPPSWWWTSESPIDLQGRGLVLSSARRVTMNPDLFYHGMLPFVSPKLRDVLEKKGTFLGEFVPAKATLCSANVSVVYWYFRLFTRRDALDRELSEVEYFPGSDHPRRVWKLRLKEDQLTDVSVFRLKGVESIFVSDALKETCQSLGLYVGFRRSSEFRLGW